MKDYKLHNIYYTYSDSFLKDKYVNTYDVKDEIYWNYKPGGNIQPDYGTIILSEYQVVNKLNYFFIMETKTIQDSKTPAITSNEDLLRWWKKLTRYGCFYNTNTMLIEMRRLTREQIAYLEAYNQHFIDLRYLHGFFDKAFIADRKKELEIIAKFKKSLHVSR